VKAHHTKNSNRPNLDVQHIYGARLQYTGHTQKNGAVSKVNKKFMSYITRVQHTPSAAATVQVSHLIITIF
jgi:hypothetical protein